MGDLKLNRSIDQWRGCDPRAMATEQSEAARVFAFEDAKADVLAQWDELQTLKKRLERYDKTLTKIAGLDEGRTQDRAVMLARRVLVSELLQSGQEG